MPLHCIDICNLILDLIQNDLSDKIIECVGPDELSFKEIIEILIRLIDKKRLFIPVPIFIANVMATFLQILPNFRFTCVCSSFA